MKDIKKKMIELAELNNSNQVMILTSNLKIDGTFEYCSPKCKGEGDELIALSDVTVCRLNDYCTCDENSCECDDYMCFKFQWLNISTHKIVGFSILKEED